MIGGVPSRRGRGHYIRGVPVAPQAVGLLECGAAAETRAAGGRAGWRGGGGEEGAGGRGVWGSGLQLCTRGQASPSPGLGLSGGEAAAPRTPKTRRLWRQRQPQPCCAM